MKTIYIFLGTLMSLILIAELGQAYTHFNKDGDFIIVFVYSSIISGIMTGFSFLWGGKNEDREIELIREKTEYLNAETKHIEFKNKYDGKTRHTF